MFFRISSAVLGLSQPVWWALALSLGLSAWAIWWPQAVPEVQEVRSIRSTATEPTLPRSNSVEQTFYKNATLEQPRLSAATADPFWPASAVPTAVPMREMPVVVPTAAAPAPIDSVTPPSPTITADMTPPNRVAGRFKDPSGKWRIFLTDERGAVSASLVAAEPGRVLSSGWRVHAANADSVVLVGPQGHQVSLPSPTDETASVQVLRH